MTDSPHPHESYTDEQRKLLLALAASSVRHGVDTGRPLTVDPARYDPPLREIRATFVTLHVGETLRGCIGVIEPRRSLVEDVAANAFAAAFRDPRFEPVRTHELPALRYHLSILTPATPLHFTSEADLLRQITPQHDGLILQDGKRRGTFLPSVWESLPRKQDFLAHLKRKAGLPMEHWSPTVRVWRYGAIEVS